MGVSRGEHYRVANDAKDWNFHVNGKEVEALDSAGGGNVQVLCLCGCDYKYSVAVADLSKTSTSTCFVATAALGTSDHYILDDLRRFRDNRLADHRAGRVFIAWYYRHGPLLARHIHAHPRRRALVRWLVVAPAHKVATTMERRP